MLLFITRSHHDCKQILDWMRQLSYCQHHTKLPPKYISPQRLTRPIIKFTGNHIKLCLGSNQQACQSATEAWFMDQLFYSYSNATREHIACIGSNAPLHAR